MHNEERKKKLNNFSGIFLEWTFTMRSKQQKYFWGAARRFWLTCLHNNWHKFGSILLGNTIAAQKNSHVIFENKTSSKTQLDSWARALTIISCSSSKPNKIKLINTKQNQPYQYQTKTQPHQTKLIFTKPNSTQIWPSQTGWAYIAEPYPGFAYYLLFSSLLSFYKIMTHSLTHICTPGVSMLRSSH